MAITVTTARSRARSDFLDDDGTRWSDAEVDRALQFALSSVFDEYLRRGGDRFIATTTGTTTSGSLDLSSLSPAQIYGVSLNVGDGYFPLRYAPLRERQQADSSARALSIEYARTPSVGTAAQPLVSDGAGNALNTWDDFDDLVCARAAQSMAVKDGRTLQTLDRWAAQLQDTVMRRPHTPRARSFPFGKNAYDQFLYWYWDAPNETIQLLRRVQ